jgi:hypothetical protein
MTYTWNINGTTHTTPSNNSVTTLSATSTYSVSVKNANGCASTFTAPQTVTVNPVPDNITVSAPAVCLGTPTTFTANVGTGATTPMTYTWTINGTSTAGTLSTYVTTLPATSTYSVSIINSYGCTSSYAGQTATVNPLPNVSVTANPNPSCSGNTVTFTATVTTGLVTPMTYTWNIGGASTTTTSNTYSRVLTTTSTYSVSAKNANGCASTFTAPQTVTVTSMVTTAITIASDKSNICSGDNVTYSVVSDTGGSYQWKKGGSNITGETGSSYTYAPAAGESITCELTSSSACATSPTALSNPIVVGVTPTVIPTLTITAVPD